MLMGLVQLTAAVPENQEPAEHHKFLQLQHVVRMNAYGVREDGGGEERGLADHVALSIAPPPPW